MHLYTAGALLASRKPNIGRISCVVWLPSSKLISLKGEMRPPSVAGAAQTGEAVRNETATPCAIISEYRIIINLHSLFKQLVCSGAQPLSSGCTVLRSTTQWCAAIAQRVHSECALAAVRSHCSVGAQPLRSRCAANAQQLRSHCAACAQTLRSGCAAIAQWVRSHCEVGSQPLLSKCAVSAQRYVVVHSHCALAAGAQPLCSVRSHCAAGAQPLRSRCAAIAKWVRSHCSVVAHPLRSGCAAIAKWLRSHCSASVQ
jgi:hypothetical protein